MKRRLAGLLLVLVALYAGGCGGGGGTDNQPPAVQVQVSPAAVSLSPGGKQRFTATVGNTADQSVTWSVEPASPAGGTITADGTYTAPSATGTYTITATCDADTSKKASVQVTVQAPGAIRVLVSPPTATLSAGGKQSFTARVENTANHNVTWSASGGTITATGLYTAPQAAGNYTIRATAQADPSKKAEATVTVQPVVDAPVYLSGLTVLRRNASTTGSLTGSTSILGVAYPHSVSVETASNRDNYLVYQMGGQYARFEASVGIRDSTAASAGPSVIFTVSGADASGREIARYTSGVRHPKEQRPAERISLDVRGVHELTVMVTGGSFSPLSRGEAWFGDARVYRTGSSQNQGATSYGLGITPERPITVSHTSIQWEVGGPTIMGVTYGPSFSLESHTNGPWALFGLNGQFSRFRAKVGVKDGASSRVAVTFTVEGIRSDGSRQTLYTSAAKKEGEPAEALDVSVAGYQQLKLYVRSSDLSRGNAWFADARLLR